MTLDSICAETVRDALHAVRFAKPMAGHPLTKQRRPTSNRLRHSTASRSPGWTTSPPG